MTSQPSPIASGAPLTVTVFERTVHGTRVNIAVRPTADGTFEASSDDKRWEPGRTQGRAIRQLTRRLSFRLRILGAFQPIFASPECTYTPRSVPIHPDARRQALEALGRPIGDLFAAR